MEQNNCSVCGAPVKVIPAGISKKTGKPYNAFYKCESCGKTGNIGGNYAKPAQTYAKTYQPTQEKVNWDEVNAKKEESIAYFNAKNVAAVLISAAMQNGELKLEDAKKVFPDLVQFVYDCDKKQVGINDF